MRQGEEQGQGRGKSEERLKGVPEASESEGYRTGSSKACVLKEGSDV